MTDDKEKMNGFCMLHITLRVPYLAHDKPPAKIVPQRYEGPRLL